MRKLNCGKLKPNQNQSSDFQGVQFKKWGAGKIKVNQNHSSDFQEVQF